MSPHKRSQHPLFPYTISTQASNQSISSYLKISLKTSNHPIKPDINAVSQRFRLCAISIYPSAPKSLRQQSEGTGEILFLFGYKKCKKISADM